MQTNQRVVIIDYLRGGAAIAVVFFHLLFKGPTEKWMTTESFGLVSDVAGYGYLGVNLFFLISGFVIAQTAKSGDWRFFVASRLSRLLPAMWICASLTAITLIAIKGQDAVSISNWVASLSLVPSWFGKAGVDSAYWSLRIEVHFYIAISIILLWRKPQLTKPIIMCWLLLSTVNLVRPMWRLDFVFALTWAPYLAAGVLFSKWFASSVATSAAKSFEISPETALKKTMRLPDKTIAAGLCWCLALALGYSYKSAVKDGYEIVLFSCSTVGVMFLFFVWLCYSQPELKQTRLSYNLGAISYPLYLLHQEAGYALFNFTRNHSGLLGDANPLVVVTLIFLIMVFTSWLIHHWLEKPITKFLKRAFSHRNSLI